MKVMKNCFAVFTTVRGNKMDQEIYILKNGNKYLKIDHASGYPAEMDKVTQATFWETKTLYRLYDYRKHFPEYKIFKLYIKEEPIEE